MAALPRETDDLLEFQGIIMGIAVGNQFANWNSSMFRCKIPRGCDLVTLGDDPGHPDVHGQKLCDPVQKGAYDGHHQA